MATQKTRNQDTYVGDRPNRNRDFGHRGPQQGMGGGGMQGGGMMGNNNNMGGGMSNNMGGMNPMGNMNMGGGGNMMGGMGGGGGGGQAAFDPMAMAQFFKQVSANTSIAMTNRDMADRRPCCYRWAGATSLCKTCFKA
jgi:hypothetical protein